jgi:hypothetical protein
MTTEQPSRTLRALHFIQKNGPVRSDQIAEHCDIRPKDVSALLAPFVTKGDLVTCKVTRPGLPPVNEYRLSAGSIPSEWGNFTVRKTKAAAGKTLTATAKPIPVRQQGKHEVAKPEQKAGKTEQKAGKPDQRAPVDQVLATATATAEQLGYRGRKTAQTKPLEVTPAKNEPNFEIGDNGQLSFKVGNTLAVLTPAETRLLGNFMAKTQPVWG